MRKATRKRGTFKTGSFQEFKEFSLAVVRGERRIDASEPKIWVERSDARKARIQFQSLEAGAKLLSAKNRALLRVIVERRPKSVSELAALTQRAEQNLLRTLHKLAAVGVVRLDKGEGRAYQPIVTARTVHFEIDLLE
ncbi:MAG: transcriptional regulator [Gammaproteobacteria bacterium]